MMPEPKVSYCTVRGAIEQGRFGSDIEVWHIECRFANGEKHAPIIVDGDFPELAQQIADFLNRQGANDGK